MASISGSYGRGSLVACDGAGGRLIAVETKSGVVPLDLQLSVGGSAVKLVDLGVCTAVSVDQQIAAQFQNAFNATIYIIPFGDLPGNVVLSFIANKRCIESSNTYGVIKFYLNNRLYPTANLRPITISIGDCAFTGYLVGLSFKGMASNSILLQGQLIFKAWP